MFTLAEWIPNNVQTAHCDIAPRDVKMVRVQRFRSRLCMPLLTLVSLTGCHLHRKREPFFFRGRELALTRARSSLPPSKSSSSVWESSSAPCSSARLSFTGTPERAWTRWSSPRPSRTCRTSSPSTSSVSFLFCVVHFPWNLTDAVVSPDQEASAEDEEELYEGEVRCFRSMMRLSKTNTSDVYRRRPPRSRVFTRVFCEGKNSSICPVVAVRFCLSPPPPFFASPFFIPPSPFLVITHELVASGNSHILHYNEARRK